MRAGACCPFRQGEGLAFNTPTYPDPDNRFQYLGPGQVSASYRIVPNVTGVIPLLFLEYENNM